MKCGEFHVFALFATLCGFYGAERWPTVTDGQTSRKRGRVQPRAGGREAETYPAFGGALAHPPRAPTQNHLHPADPRPGVTWVGVK